MAPYGYTTLYLHVYLSFSYLKPLQKSALLMLYLYLLLFRFRVIHNNWLFNFGLVVLFN